MSGYTWTITSGGIITSGPGTNAITVTWNTAGPQTLSVNYSDISGCSAANATSFLVSVTPLPDSAGNITGLTPVCAGTQGITYSVAPIQDASSYFWTTPPGVNVVSGQNTNSILVNVDQGALSGDFTVYGMNSCGNGLPSPPYHLTVNHSADATAGPDTTACEGTSVTVLQSSAADQVHLHWSTTGQGTFSNDTLIHPVYFPSASDTGDVMLTLKAFSAAPCPDDSSSMIIHYRRHPLVSAGPGQSVCSLTPLVLAGSAALHCSSFSWTTTGSGTFNDPSLLHPVYTPSPADLNAGHVTLSITGLGPPCIPDSDSMNLILQKTASADAGPEDSICEGDTYHLSSATALDYSSLLWSTSGSGTFNDAGTLNPVYTPGTSDISGGSVMLTLMAASFSPCPAVSDSILIFIGRKPTCNAGPDLEVCPGSSVTITGATAMNYGSLLWTTNGSGQLSGETGLEPGYTPGPGESGEITLTLQAYGTGKCISSTALDQMKVLIQPMVHIQTRKADTIPYNSIDTLSAMVSGGSGDYQYSWEPGTLLVEDTVPEPVTINLTSDNLFILVVKDRITGCTSTDSIYVHLVIPGTIDDCLHVHNVITPNGDGVNDCWIIDCIENYPVNKVDVFNIWGDVISSNSGYNNKTKVWCGENINNEVVPDGTYYYVIKIPDYPTLTGWILVRAGTK
jgi:gliding motility-associated-like protein